MRGSGVKRPADSEATTRINNRKSIVLQRAVTAGHRLKADDLAIKFADDGPGRMTALAPLPLKRGDAATTIAQRRDVLSVLHGCCIAEKGEKRCGIIERIEQGTPLVDDGAEHPYEPGDTGKNHREAGQADLLLADEYERRGERQPQTEHYALSAMRIRRASWPSAKTHELSIRRPLASASVNCPADSPGATSTSTSRGWRESLRRQ